MIEVTDLTNAEQDNNLGFWASGESCPHDSSLAHLYGEMGKSRAGGGGRGGAPPPTPSLQQGLTQRVELRVTRV